MALPILQDNPAVSVAYCLPSTLFGTFKPNSAFRPIVTYSIFYRFERLPPGIFAHILRQALLKQFISNLHTLIISCKFQINFNMQIISHDHQYIFINSPISLKALLFGVSVRSSQPPDFIFGHFRRPKRAGF